MYNLFTLKICVEIRDETMSSKSSDTVVQENARFRNIESLSGDAHMLAPEVVPYNITVFVSP